MSTGRPNTSSKRKKSTPKKFKSRKLFASSGNDLLEEPEIATHADESKQEGQLSPSKLPTTPQNKENVPEKYPYESETVPRGRGRPKGSKNKTFPSSPIRVYSVREVKAPVYHSKIVSRSDSVTQNGANTPHRGRGRPKGSTKVKPIIPEGPKRSRGRPKGSKNKKPSKATLLKRVTSGQKIGRGRPRKNLETSDSLTPKRGRGRPKGSLNKLTSAKRLKMMQSHIEEEKEEQEQEEPEENTDNDDDY